MKIPSTQKEAEARKIQTDAEQAIFQKNQKDAETLPGRITKAMQESFYRATHMTMFTFFNKVAAFRDKASKNPKSRYADATHWYGMQISDLREIFPMRWVAEPPASADNAFYKRWSDNTAYHYELLIKILVENKWLVKSETKNGGKHTWEYTFTVDPAVMSAYLCRPDVGFRVPTDEELLTSWAPKVRSIAVAMRTRMHAWRCGDCNRLKTLQAKREKAARLLQLDLFKKEKPTDPNVAPVEEDAKEPSLLALSKIAHAAVKAQETEYVTKKDFDDRWSMQEKFNKELGEIAVETNEMQRYTLKVIDHHRDPKNNPYPEKPAFLR